MKLVPILSNDVTYVLTGENLQSVGITMGAYNLDALLIKPGIAVLQTLPSLSALIHDIPEIILNASMITFNREGIATIRSPYDGSTLKIDKQTIKAILRKLNIKKVLFPPAFTAADIEEIGLAVESINDVVITDAPIRDAIEGKVYTAAGVIDITASQFTHYHEPLEATCACDACTLNLTHAYFHHLYQETPLLAQRYLAMHNLSQYSFNQ